MASVHRLKVQGLSPPWKTPNITVFLRSVRGQCLAYITVPTVRDLLGVVQRGSMYAITLKFREKHSDMTVLAGSKTEYFVELGALKQAMEMGSLPCIHSFPPNQTERFFDDLVMQIKEQMKKEQSIRVNSWKLRAIVGKKHKKSAPRPVRSNNRTGKKHALAVTSVTGFNRPPPLVLRTPRAPRAHRAPSGITVDDNEDLFAEKILVAMALNKDVKVC